MKKALNILGRCALVFLLTLLMLAALIMGAFAVLAYGPSEEWQRRFVATFDETSAMKFVPRIYFSEEKVQELLRPAPAQPETDTFKELAFEDGTQNGPSGGNQGQVVVTDPPEDGEWLEIIDIRGSTYKGKLMVVHDPSKVIVGTLDAYGEDCYGLKLNAFISKYGAVGGTNAGGFDDPEGFGSGGVPDGLVIRNGAIAWGSAGGYYANVIGFDADHILHVGNMTGQQALELGLTSAVSFSTGPVLIKDGVMNTGLGGGMNPRTCIGQTSDGTVLMLVLEGRKPDSLGATYDDLAQIMYSYGAVNAANLDGGSSSMMYYNGEQLTRPSSLIGMRMLPTAILVLGDGD